MKKILYIKTVSTNYLMGFEARKKETERYYKSISLD